MSSRFLCSQIADRWTCPRPAVRTVILCVVVGSFSLVSARGEMPAPKKRWGVVASGHAKAKRGYSPAQQVENGPGESAPPVFTEEQRQAVAVARAHERPLLEVPVLPGLQPGDYDQPGPVTELLFPNTAADPLTGQVAGGDIALWRNSSAAGVQQVPECFSPGVVNCVASPEEPTVGVNRDVLWLSGNNYAAISGDGGITWSYRNPFDFFPADGVNDQPAGLFNGDQVVYYSPTHDLMFWYLQYDAVRDAANNPIAANIQRLAWAASREDMLNGVWHFADFSPASFGYPNNTFWLDFPDLAVTDNFLYITTNIFRLDRTGGPTGNIFRISLNQLRAGGGLTFQHYQQHSWRCCHGGTDGMFWGAHIFTTRMRVYRWGDASDIIAHDDVDHPAYAQGSFVAMGPDGRNAAGFADNRILGAYRSGGELGFMYMSAQHDDFPLPYVDVLKIRESDREYLTTETIWNPNQAWIYPSVHPNDAGAKGGTLAFVGPNLHPGLAVFIVDAQTNHSFSPLNNLYVANGTAGPSDNRWGDYFSSRRNWLDTRTWSGTGYIMTGPNVNNSDPRYVWWGRPEDVPPVDFDVNSVAVQTPGTYSVGQTLNIVANVANGGAQNANVPLFEFRLSQDEEFNFADTLLNAQSLNFAAGTTTQIAAAVPTPPVLSGNYFVGAMTPLLVDGYVGNNFGNDPQPIRVCPGFTEQPATQVVDACGSATFHAAVTPTTTGFVTHQWRWENTDLFDDFFLGGSHTDTLTIRQVYPTDAGTYDLEIHDAVCDLLSAPAELTVRPPHINSITGAGIIQACSDTTLQPFIAGVPPYNYQWRKDLANLTDDARRTGSTTEQLHFDGLRLSDTGTYDLLLANACADADNTSPTPLTVVPKPWTTVATTGPTFRHSQSMAYDSKRGVTVLFGGVYPDNSSVNRETWEWNGNTWVLRSTTGPPGLGGAGMAFDEDRGRCVLFGGWAGGSGSDPSAFRSETWEWDGTSWTQIMTTGPSARSSPGVVYDPVAQKIVLHGGFSPAAPGPYLHDTWEYDGSSGTWMQVSSDLPDAAPGNYGAVGQLGYDTVRNRRVVFNGWFVPGIGPVELRTFEWDNGQWVRVFPANDPRYQPGQPNSICCGNPGVLTTSGGIAFHEGRRMIILNNGRAPFNDGLRWTWGYDGATWRLLSINDGPPTSSAGNLVYDGARNTIVQFGGIGPFGFSPPDTWEMVDADRVEIVRQPAQRTVVNGQPVQFAVIVKGAPTYSFQWRRNGQILNDGDGVLGANTGILRISAVTLAHPGQYDVVITNDCGSVTSAAASLTVIATRFGDGDGDTDVDLDDAALLAGCRTGPGGTRAAGCEPFDFDGDGDIDLQDMAEFQLVFGS